MNEPSKEEKFRILYESTYRVRIDTAVAKQMLDTIREKCKPTLDQIRAGMESIEHNYGKHEAPAVGELVTAINKCKGEFNTQSGIDASRRSFLQALRDEPDLERRATMIFHAGDKMIPEGQPLEPPYDNGPTMIPNPHYLKCASYHPEDHIREAIRQADHNGIKRAPFIGEKVNQRETPKQYFEPMTEF